MKTEVSNQIQFKRIDRDINGNPRFVCHFLALLTDQEKESNAVGKYDLAVKRANKYGGKKFHNKQYGGGIVFQLYSQDEGNQLVNQILSEIK